ncbi:MAG: hypothetical protein JXA54_07130 [Candidatus Heimdallarchaeota archaeon]|nr:hypothetical protein [Candidatus Heimdallarchaeota archaeon]
MNGLEFYIDQKNNNYFKTMRYSFLIYFKQFFKFFLISLIPEFLFFAIFRLVILEISNDYIELLDYVVTLIRVDFINEFGQAAFFILLLLALGLFIFRSAYVSSVTWKTAEKGKANFTWAMENTIQKIPQLIQFTFVAIVIGIFPILLLIVGLLMQVRMPGIAWGMMIAAVLLPLLFGNKISAFIPGMTRDNLHLGEALQKSWRYGSKENWFKSMSIYLTVFILCIIGPYALSFYVKTQVSLNYIGILLAIGRALIYPIFDIAFTLNYLHIDQFAINRSAFRDEIIEQRKRSEELIEKGYKKNSL